MLLQPYQWISSDIQVNGQQRVCIKLWCHVKDSSEQALVRIENYAPNLIISIPNEISSPAAFNAWYEKFKLNLKKDNHIPIKIKPLKGKELYYYKKGSPDKFLKIYFASEEAKRHAFNSLKYDRWVPELQKRIKVNVCETYHIDTVMKYLTDYNQELCQWIEVDEGCLVADAEKISILDKEYRIYGSHKLKVIPHEESVDWLCYPRTASFDIEAYSDNPNKFPDSFYAANECYMMSIIVKNLNTSDEPIQYLITTRPCNQIPGAIVIEVEDEVQLMHKWAEIMIKEKITIMTGYNILRFDLRYMNDRLKINDAEQWPNISLLKNYDSKYQLTSWGSSAYGKIEMHHILCEGRYFIDMYTIIRREYKNMQDYKLETVANYFLGRGKNDLTPQDMFKAYDSDDPELMASVAKYCLIDSVLCIDLMEVHSTWAHLTETASIVDCNINQLFMSGQQIRVTRMLYRACYTNGVYLNQRPKDNKSYTGAFVYQPTPGLSENTIILDFASLYPSTIIAYNICHTTLIKPGDTYNEDDVNTFTWVDKGEKRTHRFIKKEIYKGIVPRICEKLLKERKNVRKKISPENSNLVNNILDARQKALKVCANSVYGGLGAATKGVYPLIEGAELITFKGRQMIYRCIQYIEKLKGRVVYGDTDSVMFTFNLHNEKYKRALAEYFKLDPELSNEKLSIALGHVIGVEISKMFPPPLVLEYEGVAKNILNLTKKKYGKIMLDDNGEVKKIELKGVPCVRRDNCKWARDQYFDTIKAIMNNCTYEEATAIVQDYINKLINREVPIEDLVLTGEMGKNYAEDSTYCFKVFSDRMKELGYPITTGERVKFIICEPEGSDKRKGSKMLLYEELYLKEPDKYKLDYDHYVLNVGGNTIDSLLFLSFYRQRPDLFKVDICKCGNPIEVGIVFGPCSHSISCTDCAKDYIGKPCPMCNKVIRRIVEEDLLNFQIKKFSFVKGALERAKASAAPV